MTDRIVFYDEDNLNTGDMTIITHGKLEIYNNINNVRRKTTTLTKVNVGSAYTNTWTTLPGYWTEAPSVLCSMKRIPTFFPTYQLSRQSFTINPQVSLLSEGVYQIYPAFTYIIGAASKTQTVNLTIAGANSAGISNPHSAVCTPFYASPGDNLTVSFTYHISHSTSTQGSDGLHFGITTYIYLDVARGPGYTSTLLTSRTAYSPDTAQTISSTQNLGAGFCQWRLRRVTTCIGYQSKPPNVQQYTNYLKLNSYSYSYGGTTLHPTNAEIYYLAIGK